MSPFIGGICKEKFLLFYFYCSFYRMSSLFMMVTFPLLLISWHILTSLWLMLWLLNGFPSLTIWMGMGFGNQCSFELEKEMATHSRVLTWKIPWMEKPGRLQSMGLLRVGHNWATSLLLFTFMHWRRKRQSTPIFLPRESQEQRSLVGCHLWGCTESDTTEVTWQQQQQMSLS